MNAFKEYEIREKMEKMNCLIIQSEQLNKEVMRLQTEIDEMEEIRHLNSINIRRLQTEIFELYKN